MKPRIFCLLFFFFFTVMSSRAQKVHVGAYYFGGWTGEDTSVLSKSLKEKYKERQPKWGWITSTQTVVDAQIKAAADAGLSFFCFDWYYNSKYKTNHLNRALGFYRTSPYNNMLKYCLIVCNHDPYLIGPGDWHTLVNEWVGQFKSPNYQTVNGKPFIIIFSIETLVQKFGSAAAVHAALDSLRSVAVSQGLPGVTIGVVMYANSPYNLNLAEQCGFDILTAYNYAGAGMTADEKGKFVAANVPKQVPIENLQKGEIKIWNQFPSLSKISYIPAVTLNFDPRPWDNPGNNYGKRPYYVGYSPATAKQSIKNAITWLNNNPNATPKGRIVMVYAWNEMGEGAWLTPTMTGVNYLDGIKSLLSGY